MYAVVDNDTIKFEILLQVIVVKRGNSQKIDLAEAIQCLLFKPENWLLMTDYFCVCMMLSSLPISNIPCSRSCWRL